ncbi:hypothetical protein ACHAXT_012096 [Thalassiosira profunda]
MAVRRSRLLLLLGLGRTLALGLVNVAPVSRSTAAPWIARRGVEPSPLFSASKPSVEEPSKSSPEDLQSDNALQSSGKAATQEPPVTKNSIISGTPAREGIWVPPSQNVAQRRGAVFSIRQPQDLLDFVIEDERLSVVKVYASWCKTCKVFDMRYRKLASLYGDKYDEKDPTQITQRGRVRFAEMQYDDPANEEMCKLYNATLLPYILMYKGSQGMVKEFQCGPSKFQTLIDAVNEFADPSADAGGDVGESGVISSPQQVDRNTTTEATSAQQLQPGGGDAVEELKELLRNLESEKVEMLETMKARIEHDKEYIQKLEAGVETQRSMLEAKDEEISKLNATLVDKEKEVQALTDRLAQQQKETRRANEDISAAKSQVAHLTNRMLDSSFNQKAAEEKERQMMQQIKERDEKLQSYEEERTSLRKLCVLAGKRIGRGARGLLLRVRQKR